MTLPKCHPFYVKTLQCPVMGSPLAHNTIRRLDDSYRTLNLESFTSANSYYNLQYVKLKYPLDWIIFDQIQEFLHSEVSVCGNLRGPDLRTCPPMTLPGLSFFFCRWTASFWACGNCVGEILSSAGEKDSGVRVSSKTVPVLRRQQGTTNKNRVLVFTCRH